MFSNYHRGLLILDVPSRLHPSDNSPIETGIKRGLKKLDSGGQQEIDLLPPYLLEGRGKTVDIGLQQTMC